MTKLHGIKTSNPLLALMIAEQIFDNSLVAAGLMDDSRVMLPRCEDRCMEYMYHLAVFVFILSLF